MSASYVYIADMFVDDYDPEAFDEADFEDDDEVGSELQDGDEGPPFDPKTGLLNLPLPQRRPPKRHSPAGRLPVLYFAGLCRCSPNICFTTAIASFKS